MDTIFSKRENLSLDIYFVVLINKCKISKLLFPHNGIWLNIDFMFYRLTYNVSETLNNMGHRAITA